MPIERILVTGGAGFIGSRLVTALLAKYPRMQIWVFDNLHPQVHGPAPLAPPSNSRVIFKRGDISDADAVHSVVAEARPQWIYHLAAETGTGQSYDEPTRYARVNILGTTLLVEAVRRCPDTRKVILAASRAVYGEGAYADANGRVCCGLPRQSGPMKAGDFTVPLPAGHEGPGRAVPTEAGLAVAPASIYASSKLMQEYILAQAGEGAPWRANMLRFQNVYGPGQSLRNPYTGVLSIFARALIAGEDLAIFEDGQIARDFVFVDDVVDALVRAGEASTRHGDVLDIGSGKAITILDAARLLMRFLGRPETSYRITGEFRIGDIRHACADIRRARQELGWEPKVSVEHGLRALADWAKTEYAAVVQTA